MVLDFAHFFKMAPHALKGWHLPFWQLLHLVPPLACNGQGGQEASLDGHEANLTQGRQRIIWKEVMLGDQQIGGGHTNTSPGKKVPIRLLAPFAVFNGSLNTLRNCQAKTFSNTCTIIRIRFKEMLYLAMLNFFFFYRLHGSNNVCHKTGAFLFTH